MYVDPNGPPNYGGSTWNEFASHFAWLGDRISSRNFWAQIAGHTISGVVTLGAGYLLLQQVIAQRPEQPPPPIPPTQPPNESRPAPLQPIRERKPEGVPFKPAALELNEPKSSKANHRQAVLEFGRSTDCLLSVTPPKHLPRPPADVQEHEIVRFQLSVPNGILENFEGVILDEAPIVKPPGDDPYGSYYVAALVMPETLESTLRSDLAGRCLSITTEPQSQTIAKHRSKSSGSSNTQQPTEVALSE